MAFLSIEDHDFWGRNTGDLKPIGDAGGLDGIALSRFVLGKPGEGDPPAVTALRMTPGYVLPRHTHDCYRMEIVVQGALEVEGRTLKPGDIMISEPRVFYGPHTAGPDGCITMEIFSNYHGAQSTFMEGPSGELVECNITTEEGAKKMMEFVKQQRASRAP